jgi:hypothetical protein
MFILNIAKICPVDGTEIIEKPEFYAATNNP